MTATFDLQFNLALTKSGGGTGNVTSVPSGISCGTTCASQTKPFDSGLSVNLTATADAGSRFVSFTGCTSTTGTSCSVNMSAAANVTATFYQQFNLTLTKSGAGTGSVTSDLAGISCGTNCGSQQAPYDSGVKVTLTAVPNASSTFGGFSGNCITVGGNPNACTITMSAAASVTAAFVPVSTAPCCVMAPLFSDNFTRTTGLGGNWTSWQGGYTTDGQSAISEAPPASGNWASVVPSMRTDDYAIVSDVMIPAGSLSSGIVARGSPSVFTDNLYSAQLSTDGNVYLSRRNSGTWTVLGTAAAAITANTRYTLKLLAKGSNPVHLEVSLNGALQIEWDDASPSRITSGLPGIENNDSNVKYFSFSVYSAPIFDDNFTRSSGLGANWNVWEGSFTTNGQTASSGAPPAGGSWASVVPAVATNDYVVNSDIVIPPGSLASGVVARGSTTQFTDTLYAAQLATDGNAYLYRRNAWNWTTLASSPLGIVANVRYNLRLVVSGSNPVHLEVWVNGTRKIVADDASANRILSGLPGIENYDANVQYSGFGVYQAPLFDDTFNRTTGLGTGWSVIDGTYTTDGTAAISGVPPVPGNWAAATTSLATSDYAVQADMSIPAHSMSSGIVARSAVTNAFDSDVYALKLGSDGTLNLYRRNSWNWTLLGSVNAGITAGTSYTIRLVTTGTSPVHLEAWLNGILQISYDDASTSRLTTGAGGIENYDSGVRYTTFCVTKQ